MKPSKTSKQWMREHVNDPFVQLAQKEGYRSRAAYKLLEIDDKGITCGSAIQGIDHAEL